MGQRRLAKGAPDDQSKRPRTSGQKKPSNNSVLGNTSTRRGEVFRAQRRINETVNVRSSQHVISVPVNKSIYNGYDGKQFSLTDFKKQARSNVSKLKVIPVGGLGEMTIGKNMMAIEYENDIIIIDCGFLFPGADYPGINYIIPDTSYLEANVHKVRAVVFTHGHLDHIGAFRHIAHKFQVPVYGSKFTLAMVKRTMEESTHEYEPEYIEMDPEAHDQIQVSEHFNIELVRVNHSIPDATAVVVRTPVGVLVNTGDWRFEDDPVDGKHFDLKRLTEISTKEGILMLMSDSTNCGSSGSHEHTEIDIQHSINQVMDKYPNSRLIISCFSSHIHRIQSILTEAKAHNRKVAFAGYSMIQNLEVALRTGAIKVPKDVVVKMEDIAKLSDSKVTIVGTGSQGELNAVLNRMATGAHRHIKIKSSDVIVFSSSPIPGNETYVVRTVDGLMREGSDVVQNGKTEHMGIGPLHLSGHGYFDDHIKLITALNPTYYLPIHGEFHMLVRNAEIAEIECGMPRQNIFVADSGDIIEVTPDKVAKKNGRIQVGGVMYDDSGEVVSEVVLKDRLHMSQEGMFIVMLTVQRGSGRLLTSPDIISRGFIYMRDKEELMGTIRQYLKQKVQRQLSGKQVDMDVFKKELKEEITHILYDQTRRTPIVIPVVNEVGGSGGSGGSQRSSASGGRNNQSNGRAGNRAPARKFPPRQVPDSEVTARQHKSTPKAY